MKVIVFGNIGSGKTSLIKKLAELYPFEVIAIDDFRRNYSDGTEEGELVARVSFFNAIKPGKNQFIECCGVGKVAIELFELCEKYTDEFMICVVLHVSDEICKLRIVGRKHDVPFPKSLDMIFSFIERAGAEISGANIKDKWNKRVNTIVLSKQHINAEDTLNIINQIALFIDTNIIT